MREGLGALVQWQQRVASDALPPYDDALLRRELALFPDWCVTREYGLAWNEAQCAQWQGACDLLVRSALAQPTVAVHRDWMPRNLMVSEPNPGILDFQDAVRGPITYDVASMLRDAFISWDEERELDWAVRYWQQARKAALPVDDDFGEFWRQLEWMGLQRHLKVLGIFCRLKHRDGKPKYSADLPRFFTYAYRVCTRYNGLGALAALIEPLAGNERVDAGYTLLRAGRHHLRNGGCQPLGVRHIQELVRPVRVALRAEHAAHHHLRVRKALLQQAHQRDRAALADVADRRAVVRERRFVEHALEPRRDRRRVPPGRAVRTRATIGARS